MACIAAFNINEPWPCDCFTPNKIRFLPFLLLSFVGDALPYAERVGLWVKRSGFYVMCFQARHFTCSVSFPTQGYTWVPTNWQGSLLRCREEGEGGTLSNVCFFFLFFIQNDEKVIEKANQLMAAVNADMPPPSGPVNIGLIVLSCLSYEISPAVWFASFASKCHTQESVCLLVFLSACCSICLSVVPLVSVGLTFCRLVCVPVCHS